MSKFNQLYTLTLESIDKKAVYQALSVLEDSSEIQPNRPKIKHNRFIQEYEKTLEQYAIKINNAVNNTTTTDRFEVQQILNILEIKGANRYALNKIKELLLENQEDTLKLYNNINVLKLDTISKEFRYTKTFDFTQDFFINLLKFLNLNKTTSTANIGNGQLLLGLIIKGASLNGLDDLNIDGNEYNVKYITKHHQYNNAIISIEEDEKVKTLNDHLSDLNNDNKSKTTLKFEIKDKGVIIKRISEEDLQLVKEILAKNLQGVKGFILVANNSYYEDDKIINNIVIKVIKSRAIINNPLTYLYGLGVGQRFGFYFNGSSLFVDR